MMLLNAKLTRCVGCGNHHGSASKVYRLPVNLLCISDLQFRLIILILRAQNAKPGTKAPPRGIYFTERFLKSFPKSKFQQLLKHLSHH
jgi:hypothetical protein